MKQVYVKDLQLGQDVSEHFVVTERHVGHHRPHNDQLEPFLRVTLADRTGRINGIMWDQVEKYAPKVQTGSVLQIKGRVTEYRGDAQITIYACKTAQTNQFRWDDFLTTSKLDRETMEQQIEEAVNSVQTAALRSLLESIFSEDDLLTPFLEATAAAHVHHAYIGGLAEHSLEVLQLSMHMEELFNDTLNRDMLIAGALLHDIGKIETYQLEGMTFERTDQGKLFGHLFQGMRIVEDRISRLNDFPSNTAKELLHMIASHHGKQEWKTIEQPKTANAYALYLADLVSSRMNQVVDHIEKQKDNGPWTGQHPHLNTEFFTGFIDPSSSGQGEPES